METYRHIEDKPKFKYTGDIVHSMQVYKDNETDNDIGHILTSVERRCDDNLIHIYRNGKRVFGKRVSKDRALIYESMDLIKAIITDIKKA